MPAIQADAATAYLCDLHAGENVVCCSLARVMCQRLALLLNVKHLEAVVPVLEVAGVQWLPFVCMHASC